MEYVRAFLKYKNVLTREKLPGNIKHVLNVMIQFHIHL